MYKRKAPIRIKRSRIRYPHVNNFWLMKWMVRDEREVQIRVWITVGVMDEVTARGLLGITFFASKIILFKSKSTKVLRALRGRLERAIKRGRS